MLPMKPLIFVAILSALWGYAIRGTVEINKGFYKSDSGQRESDSVTYTFPQGTVFEKDCTLLRKGDYYKISCEK